MTVFHQFACTTAPAGLVYECTTEECGRRIVVDRQGAMTIITGGDQLAVHRGGAGGVDLVAPAVTQR